MSRYFLALMIGWHAIATLPVFVFADEPKSGALMQTLPADGVWVTYSVNVSVNEQESLMTITGRSVGKDFYRVRADSRNFIRY